jgi:hypothetical protein
MALIDLWNSARSSIQDKHVQQVIGFSGNGKLADTNETSREFREYLSYIPSEVLIRYANDCLTSSFDQSGFALQDIVNQIGKRLSFDVIDGAYRGRKGAIGFDGIWKSNTGADIVVEVKTTDAYRIDLDTIAQYRSNLIKVGRISERKSSILIVVGRQDTGDLEAQIRGSRHAWDVRLISVEALIRLMQLKEKTEDADFLRKITTILTPREYTKVDEIIDLVFSTAEELSIDTAEQAFIQQGIDDVLPAQTVAASTNGVEPAPTVPDQPNRASFQAECIARVSEKLGAALVKQSRTTYRTPDDDLAVSCAVSKEYRRSGRSYYWFAFHPEQQAKLERAAKAYAVFGCGSEQTTFLFPYSEWVSWLPGLNETANEDRHYWHVQITQMEGRWIMLRKSGFQSVDITDYLI